LDWLGAEAPHVKRKKPEKPTCILQYSF
jgi:hypothetical protein